MHTRYLTYMKQEERQHHNNTGSRWIRPTDLYGVTPSPDIRFPSLFVRFHWLVLPFSAPSCIQSFHAQVTLPA